MTIRNRWRRWRLRRQIKIAKKILARVDRALAVGGFSRPERKQFRRDLIGSDDGLRRAVDLMAGDTR
jgi:hypothetical protein